DRDPALLGGHAGPGAGLQDGRAGDPAAAGAGQADVRLALRYPGVPPGGAGQRLPPHERAGVEGGPLDRAGWAATRLAMATFAPLYRATMLPTSFPSCSRYTLLVVTMVPFRRMLGNGPTSAMMLSPSTRTRTACGFCFGGVMVHPSVVAVATNSAVMVVSRPS